MVVCTHNSKSDTQDLFDSTLNNTATSTCSISEIFADKCWLVPMFLDTPRQQGPQMLMNGADIGRQLTFAQCVGAFSWFLMMASNACYSVLHSAHWHWFSCLRSWYLRCLRSPCPAAVCLFQKLKCVTTGRITEHLWQHLLLEVEIFGQVKKDWFRTLQKKIQLPLNIYQEAACVFW